MSVDLDEVIQLDLDGVEHLTPPYANIDDVLTALEHSAMTVKEIFYEFEIRTQGSTAMSQQYVADTMRQILYDNYLNALKKYTAHKSPVTL